MKKFQNKAILCAMALIAATGFVSCSSSEDVAEAPVNPTYDGNSVKTQFAINVAKANGTRMSADETQNNNNYKEITNVRLFTFAKTPADNTAFGKYIELGDPGSVKTGNCSHIYKNVDIPVGTSDFVFYSTRSGIGTDAASKFTTGSMKSTLFTIGTTFSNLGDISIAGEKTLTNEDRTAINNTIRPAFEGYLNGIDGALKTVITELSAGNAKNNLENYRINFTGLRGTAAKGQRAGSANAILQQVQNLYTNILAITEGLTDSQKESLKNAIVKEVKSGETHCFTVNDNSGTLSYATGDETYTNFPVAQNLPEGTQVLTYKEGAFKYETTASSVIGDEIKINTENIIYPLPIVYYDNTPAKAKDESINTWKTTTAEWNASSTWTEWDNAVKATTQSIALKNNINYGVAALKTTVKCGSSPLKDNKKAYYEEEEDQDISIPAAGYSVTGILIGGQPENVGWQMINTASTDRKYVVYDKVTNGAKAQTTASSDIYTLVFDNWTSATTGQEPVNVVLELLNPTDATAFYGQDGIIEAGQKFYLIAKLDPKDKTLTWPTYPETFNSEANTLPKSYEGRYPVKSGANRVFVQDYTTTANFTINSLKNAYVTIPDLQATKLQLGISVDLKWEAGLTFDVTIE